MSPSPSRSPSTNRAEPGAIPCGASDFGSVSAGGLPCGKGAGGLAEHLLAALGATGRMAEVLHANDIWIARPLRDLLDEGRTAGVIHAEDVPDAANAMLGALLLAVLGRSVAEADTADPRFHERLTDQLLRSVMRR